MPVQIVLDGGRGQTVLLPESFRLEAEEAPYVTSSVEIAGQDGEHEFPSARRLAPRPLRASAVLVGVSQADADRLAEELRAKLLGGPLWIYPEAGASRFIRAHCDRVTVDRVPGHYRGTVRQITCQFTALRPFWRDASIQTVTRQVSESPETWTVTQPGTSQVQAPVVRITARAPLVNPVLEHQGTGARIAYRGALLTGQSLVTRSDPCLAYRGVVSLQTVRDLWGVTYAEDHAAEPVPGAEPVIHQMAEEWLDDGFWLVPGENVLTYRDDASSSHQATIEITWRPRYV